MRLEGGAKTQIFFVIVLFVSLLEPEQIQGSCEHVYKPLNCLQDVTIYDLFPHTFMII